MPEIIAKVGQMIHVCSCAVYAIKLTGSWSLEVVREGPNCSYKRIRHEGIGGQVESCEVASSNVQGRQV